MPSYITTISVRETHHYRLLSIVQMIMDCVEEGGKLKIRSRQGSGDQRKEVW
jgi:hypothetical protein